MSRPLKILMVMDSFFPDSHGGAERMVDGWSRELAAGWDEVCVLASRIGGSTGLDEEANGYRVRRWTSRHRSFRDGYISAVIACAKAAKKFCEEWRPDVVHCHQGLSAYAVFRSGITAPVIYTFYGAWRDEFLEDARAKEDGRSPLLRTLYRLGVRVKAAQIHHMEGDALVRSQAVSVVSAFSRDFPASAHGFSPEYVDVIRGGVNLEKFSPVPGNERGAIRRRLSFSGLTILSVRRLVRRTGIDILLESMVQLCSRVPDVNLVVVGTGPEEEVLRRMANDLGVGRSVRFAGFVDDEVLPDYYRAADLFILSTRSLEGFGMSTVEALASGTPVIGTPAGATPEILRPLEKGLLAAETSSIGITKAAMPWLVYPSASKDMRARCRAYTEKHYRWSDAGNALSEVYSRMISERTLRG